MTRIFGYESSVGENEHIPTAIKEVLDNLQKALSLTYQINRHAYGLGFIVITKENRVLGFSVYRGYRGLT